MAHAPKNKKIVARNLTSRTMTQLNLL